MAVTIAARTTLANNQHEPCPVDDPRQWSSRRKIIQLMGISFFSMLGPLASTIPAPALNAISQDLGIQSKVVKTMVVSIFVAGFGLGPLLAAPTSEMFGRVVTLQASNIMFALFNLGCSFARTPTQILTLRFLAGAGSASGMSVGGGMIAEIFAPEDRGVAVSVWALGPTCAPAIGPVAAGFIVRYSSWRWVFWSTSIFATVISFLGLFMRESHAPTIQRRMQTEAQMHSSLRRSHQTTLTALGTNLVRPFRLMTQPIVMALSLYVAYLYGVVYLVFSTFFNVFVDPNYYGQAIEIASLQYIALAIGFLLGSQVRAPMGDLMFNYLKKKNNGVISPEYRLPPILLGAFFAPVGLILYGWTTELHRHWAIADVGAAIFAFSANISFASTQSYLIDCYEVNASSAIAASFVLRNIAGFVLPLAGPSMYDRLGLGWGNTMLAAISIFVGIPAPILLWIFGPRLQARSPFARSSSP